MVYVTTYPYLEWFMLPWEGYGKFAYATTWTSIGITIEKMLVPIWRAGCKKDPCFWLALFLSHSGVSENATALSRLITFWVIINNACTTCGVCVNTKGLCAQCMFRLYFVLCGAARVLLPTYTTFIRLRHLWSSQFILLCIFKSCQIQRRTQISQKYTECF